MIARIQKSMKEKDQGFTLIELLVVMIIIGILAAIAIPIFLSQREKAQDSAAKADVSTLGKEIATWFVDNTAEPHVAIDGDNYVLGADAASAQPIGTVSDNVTITADISSTAGDESTTWCIGVSNTAGDVADVAGGGAGYEYSAAGGLGEGQC